MRHPLLYTAAEAAVPQGSATMFGFNVGIGVALVLIAMFAWYLIHKRVQDKGLKKLYLWVAWIGAILGGTALSINWGDWAGMSSGGAAVVSILGLMVIAADLRDKKPDVQSFILMIFIPSFMRLVDGNPGKIFDAILFIPSYVVSGIGIWLGF